MPISQILIELRSDFVKASHWHSEYQSLVYPAQPEDGIDGISVRYRKRVGRMN
jgi:hypothetical protein